MRLKKQRQTDRLVIIQCPSETMYLATITYGIFMFYLIEP